MYDPRPPRAARPRRLARLAACTALALSAGTLLSAGPAAAVDRTPVRPAALSVARPHLGADAARTPVPYATVAARPRLDLDRDGQADQLLRFVDGSSQVLLSGSQSDSSEPFAIHGDTQETVKDVIQVGNAGGTAAPELLTLSYDGRLSLHPTTAKGAGAPTWSGYGWQVYNRVIGAGDLTKDGRPDLLARTPGGELFLYKGTGTLTGQPFAPRIRVGTGWGQYDQLVGSGDLDRDGVADLLGRTTAGDLYFYRGTGSATVPFSKPVKVGPGWNAYNQIIAADDLNGDGRTDLLARTYAGRVYLYLSTGSGRFGARVDGATSWKDIEFVVGAGITPSYGKHTLLARTADGTAYVYLTRADGTFAGRAKAPYTLLVPGSGLLSATGLDKINWATPVETRGASVWIHRANVAGLAGGIPDGTKVVAGPGDLTGDGRGDLLSRDAFGLLFLHPGDGTGTGFTPRVRVGAGWDAYDVLTGAGDVTGDGRPDLVARSGGTLYLFPGTGSATAPFGARTTIGTGWSGYTRLASPGDLDGDGRADLVARDTAGSLYRYSATGRGGTATFAARVLIGGGWNAYTGLS
ncbi:VCBS repeat-containing protein [Streptomyces sp. NRRL S-87]|uniref:FG-GAP repeat domain-containing protein n=1 Tax=Streptomyces sp. NRRL S-87 TaxID=1463920 RepID=UPI0004C0E00F|nr:VCBS repeat-containing protein [Streptomyces sp. NRRL S-87]